MIEDLSERFSAKILKQSRRREHAKLFVYRYIYLITALSTRDVHVCKI